MYHSEYDHKTLGEHGKSLKLGQCGDYILRYFYILVPQKSVVNAVMKIHTNNDAKVGSTTDCRYRLLRCEFAINTLTLWPPVDKSRAQIEILHIVYILR